jgi:hypothetical protein
MKTKTLIIATYLIFCSLTNLIAQDTIKRNPGFNGGLGVIIASSSTRYDKFLDGSTVYGVNIGVNKIVKKIILIGINSDIGSIQKKGYTFWAFGDAYNSKSTGIYTNIFANVSCFFLGNSVNSKGGMYFKFGLGLVWYKSKYTITHKGFHIIDDVEDSYLNFSGQLCLGGDVKLGPGRLFVEIASIPVITGTLTEKETIKYSTESTKHNTDITDKYSGEFGGRIGYRINF